MRISFCVLLASLVLAAPACATSVEATFSAPGPYATTTSTLGGYDVFAPANYNALSFGSPIVTWGDGTGALPAQYTTFLSHLASWGFTVVAVPLANTGSGVEIDAAGRWLAAQNTLPGSLFRGHLDTSEVAAVGHSQGATGAVRAATADPGLIRAVETFSLPSDLWSGANADCATPADCTYHVADLTQPAFYISTRGPYDAIISSPLNALGNWLATPGPAIAGIVTLSDGTLADHTAIEDGQVPGGLLGYATAWLEWQLRRSPLAAPAFSGPSPQLAHDLDWWGSLLRY